MGLRRRESPDRGCGFGPRARAGSIVITYMLYIHNGPPPYVDLEARLSKTGSMILLPMISFSWSPEYSLYKVRISQFADILLCREDDNPLRLHCHEEKTFLKSNSAIDRESILFT
jgi:hypothetical protein